MKVEVQSRKFIAPSTPTPSHLRDFKISLLDQINEHFVVFIIYYLPGASENGFETCETRNKQLQKSLAETLTLLYPYAGRHNHEKLAIDCNDYGVEYVEAKVSGKQLCEVVNGKVETVLLDQLVPLRFGWEKSTSGEDFLYIGSIESLMAVQANMFDCGGLAIGVCISHMIGDGFTITKFIDTWARVSRDGVDQLDAAKFPSPSLFPARDSVENFVGQPKKGLISKMVMFDGARIADLKKDLKTTRVKLVLALIWKAVTRLHQAKRGYLRRTIITNTMNLRGKVKLPIEDSCGNLTTSFTAEYVPDNHGNEVEIPDLICLLDDALRKNIRDYAELESEDLCGKTVKALKDTSELEFLKIKGEADIIHFTSWCRLPLYEADFGWGKPIWLSFVSNHADLVIPLLDSRDGNGIEAWISLEQNDMVQFLQDPDIVAFTPTSTS